MKVFKKLALLATLALNMPFIAQAYGTFFYEYEKNCILNFAQELRLQNSYKAQNVAQWLDNKAMWSDDAILLPTAAGIVNNHALTMESKITLLGEMMQKEARDNRNHKIRGIAEAICATLLFTGFCALLTYAIIEDIKNPRPIVWVQPRQPRINLTFRAPTVYPSWQFPCGI